MSDDNTNDPWAGIRQSGPSKYFHFDEPGDSVEGVITAKRVGMSYEREACPEIDIRTEAGTTSTVTAGQAQLKRLILEADPSVGDTISILYTRDEQGSRGFPMKCFTVEVEPGA